MEAITDIIVNVVREPIDRRAAMAAVVAYYVTRNVVRRFTTVEPYGPLVHFISMKESKSPAFLRALVGELPSIWVNGAFKSDQAYTHMAREAKSDVRAVPSYVLFGRTYVVTSNPMDSNYVLAKKAKIFTKGDAFRILEPVVGQTGLVTIVDEHFHTVQRRKISRAFTTPAVKSMVEGTIFPHMKELMHTIRTKTRSEAKEANRLGRKTEGIFLDKETFSATLAVIAECAFEQTGPDVQLTNDLLTEATKAPNPLVLLGMDIYLNMPVGQVRNLRKLRNKLGDQLVAHVEKHRARFAKEAMNDDDDDVEATASAPATGYSGPKRTTLLELLASDKDFTREHLLDNCITFVIAGQETTLLTFTWGLFALAQREDLQELLFEEVTTALKGQPMTTELLAGLPNLNAFIYEVLRLYPPVNQIPRFATEDQVLPCSRTFIPKGTGIFVPVQVLHNDEEIWGSDATTFRPQRWIDEPDLMKRVNGSGYLPFGAGKRGCIGREFAMLELLTAYAMMIRMYKVQWPEDQADPVPLVVITTKPKDPFRLIFEEREEATLAA